MATLGEVKPLMSVGLVCIEFVVKNVLCHLSMSLAMLIARSAQAKCSEYLYVLGLEAQ